MIILIDAIVKMNLELIFGLIYCNNVRVAIAIDISQGHDFEAVSETKLNVIQARLRSLPEKLGVELPDRLCSGSKC